ncbi:MAG: hypothetical protein [Microviridae sp.]|nr:MAG: hypothetical protein [Microviridae sp.]
MKQNGRTMDRLRSNTSEQRNINRNGVSLSRLERPQTNKTAKKAKRHANSRTNAVNRLQQTKTVRIMERNKLPRTNGTTKKGRIKPGINVWRRRGRRNNRKR